MSDRFTSSQTQEAILISSYAAIQSDDDISFTEKRFFECLKSRSSMAMIRLVLQTLDDQNYFSFDPTDGLFFPTRKLVEHVEGRLLIEGMSYQEKLSSIFQTASGAADSVDSDTWRPIVDESDGVAKQEAIEAVQDVIDRITTDNGFAGSQPEARNSILFSLNAGIEMLKAHMPSREQVTALLLKPLKYLGDLFAKHAIGELTKKATDKLLAWLSGF
jgi:hypothetical protein